MAEAAPKQSESMEDILQSIKRIIEDEGDTQAKPAAAAAPADILELTQVIKDDGTITTIPPLPSMGPAKPPAPEPAKPAVAAPAPAAAVAAPAPAAPSPPAANPAPKPSTPEDTLVSDQATQAALAALKPLVEGGKKEQSIPHVPSAALRNGTTVEDLMLEALKPMLKSWLDEHLPLIVQKIVEKEVKRIVKFQQD